MITKIPSLITHRVWNTEKTFGSKSKWSLLVWQQSRKHPVMNSFQSGKPVTTCVTQFLASHTSWRKSSFKVFLATVKRWPHLPMSPTSLLITLKRRRLSLGFFVNQEPWQNPSRRWGWKGGGEGTVCSGASATAEVWGLPARTASANAAAVSHALHCVSVQLRAARLTESCCLMEVSTFTHFPS